MKVNKALNEFARTKFGNGQMYFDDFLASNYKDDAEIKALSANNDPAGGTSSFPPRKSPVPVQQFVYESLPIRQLATVTTSAPTRWK